MMTEFLLVWMEPVTFFVAGMMFMDWIIKKGSGR